MNTKRGQKVRIQVVKYTHGSCVIKQTWKLEELHRIEFYEEESSVTIRVRVSLKYYRILVLHFILINCTIGQRLTHIKEMILLQDYGR